MKKYEEIRKKEKNSSKKVLTKESNYVIIREY